MLSGIRRKLKLKKLSLVAFDAIESGAVVVKYPPVEVFIEPTNYCNLSCTICPQHNGLRRRQGFMSLDTFEKALREIKEMNTPKVTLHFCGESLLNKDLSRMASLSNKAGLYTRLHTNATLFSEENARSLIESGLDELSISFDDPRKDVYESVRLNASYEKTLQNIRCFLEMKKRLSAPKPYVIMQRMVNGNQGDSLEVENSYRRLFSGLPVDKFRAIQTHNWAGDYRVTGNAPQAPAERSSCLAIWFRFVVAWDGKVHACCNEMHGRLELGDLSQNSLAEIWNGPKMAWLRQMMLDGRFDEIEACKDCDSLIRCRAKKLGILQKSLARLFR